MKGVISIIVPVYNSKDYLDRCIQSILSQTYQYWELLLIDDGSVDTSGEICDRYAARDDRIRVFHQMNKGVSTARNVGLANANGDYIAFCDSDDWVENNWLETMYMSACTNDCDVVYCDATYHYHSNHKIIVPSIDEEKDKVSFFRNYLVRGYALWCIMVKTRIIKDNNIWGLDGYIFCEDLYLSVNIFLYSDNVFHVCQALYNYNCMNSNSLVATQRNKDKYQRNIQEGIDVIEKLISIFKQHSLYEELEQQLGWAMLKAKVGWIFIRDKRKEYVRLHPEFNKYIHTNPLTSKNQKRLQTIMNYPFLWWTIDLVQYIWNFRQKDIQ